MVVEKHLLWAMPILPLTTLLVWLTPCTPGQAASTSRTCCHFKRPHGDSDWDRDGSTKRTLSRLTRSVTESHVMWTSLSMVCKLGCDTSIGWRRRLWTLWRVFIIFNSELPGEHSLFSFCNCHHATFKTYIILNWSMQISHSNFIILC